MQGQQDVLIVGSGLSIRQLDQVDTTHCLVVGLNKAWRYAPQRFDYLIHSDMLPGSQRPADHDFAPGHVVSYSAYHPVVRDYAQRWSAIHQQSIDDPAMFLSGHLIHFNASYWVMQKLQPRRIAYLGCDFDYSNDQSHYYGKGQAVFAEERGRRPLRHFFACQIDLAQRAGIELYNLSTAANSQLPYPRLEPLSWTNKQWAALK
ncbi:MAG: hypothetical protein Tsb002_19290 [Wenzhouxiangellaceae bacterium]